VECRGYSEDLQRAMTDFGADEAFAGAAAKLQEHYGIEVPVVGIELRRACCRWRVTSLALSIARWDLISTMATVPEAPL